MRSTYQIKVAGTQNIDTVAVSRVAGSFTPATASGHVTVTYNYTEFKPIPEPGTWMMVCMGLSGCLFYPTQAPIGIGCRQFAGARIGDPPHRAGIEG